MMCLTILYCTEVYPIAMLYFYTYNYTYTCVYACTCAMLHYTTTHLFRIDQTWQTWQVSSLQTSRWWIWQPHLGLQHLYYIVPHTTKVVAGDIPILLHSTTLPTPRWLRCGTMLHTSLHHAGLFYWGAMFLYVYPYIYWCSCLHQCYAVSYSILCHDSGSGILLSCKWAHACFLYLCYVVLYVHSLSHLRTRDSHLVQDAGRGISRRLYVDRLH